MLGALLAVLPGQEAIGRRVSVDEARVIAKNWVRLVVSEKGSWGDHETGEVGDIQPLGRGGRQSGFLCSVEPAGYIVVSLHKGLAPVKVYSTDSDLDPTSDRGMSDLIKRKMERVIQAVERVTGKQIDDVSEDLIKRALEVDYSESSKILSEPDMVIVPPSKSQTKSLWSAMMYTPGTAMLETLWHQGPPYNDQCPQEGCGWPEYNYWNNRALVGCVATAGAQVLRYWRWPPSGSDGVVIPWKDMRQYYNFVYFEPTNLSYFWTEQGAATTAELEAVAWLSRRVGVKVDMDYDCDESGADTYDMEGVFQSDYYYSNSCSRKDRDDYTANSWWSMLVNQFNANRPVLYRVENHAIVLDGHQTLTGGIRQYHTNYGWGGTAWYTLDGLHLGGIDEEYALVDIVPSRALDNTLEGSYEWSLWPLYYFDKDAHGTSANFDAGLKLQILNPGLIIEGRGSGDEALVFAGSNELDPDLHFFQLHTVFYYHGDEEGKTRLKIYDGEIRIKNYGQIVFHD